MKIGKVLGWIYTSIFSQQAYLSCFAELGSKGLSKIIIPTVYREDYMGALRKLTKQRDADAYIRMLFRAWEFSSHVHDENLEGMEGYLTACNAFLMYKEGYLKILPRM